ncbi:EamA family transporter [Thioclava sp. GXIMD4215]|uniref:EamA family transporter n=1 Tax=Thioclava sp. GXIMD4215 TaxID=3131928 RepID=UPI00311AD2C9
MTLSAILLVLCAAFLHAGWNLLAKRAAQAGPVFVLAYSACACLIYTPWVVWIFWRSHIAESAADLDATGPSLTGLLVMVASGLIHLAYNLCLQQGYAKADLSVVYPVARGTGPLLSVLGAFVLLQEPASLTGIAGMLCVVTGIVLIASQGRLAMFWRPEGRTGLLWGLLTGSLIACYTLTDATAVKLLGVAPVLLEWVCNLMRVAMLAPLALKNRHLAGQRMRGHWRRAAGIGLFSPLAYILVLTAIAHGAPLSLVAPLRESSMMVGALLGMVLLKEAVGPARLAGCAILVLGVVLLSGS